MSANMVVLTVFILVCALTYCSGSLQDLDSVFVEFAIARAQVDGSTVGEDMIAMLLLGVVSMEMEAFLVHSLGGETLYRHTQLVRKDNALRSTFIAMINGFSGSATVRERFRSARCYESNRRTSRFSLFVC